jgi:transposase
MRKIREVLRLHFELKLKHREIARSCRLSPTRVSQIVSAAEAAGLCWPLPATQRNSELAAQLFGAEPRAPSRQLPDFGQLALELKRSHVTRQLLWEEYRREHPDGYGYSQFCEHFNRFLVTAVEPELRQEHRAGEKLFVDWAGDQIGYREDGQEQRASLFVAVLGASNYTFAQVYRDQRLANWIQAHVEAFAYFGGVPAVVTPDHTKTAVTKSSYYEPALNPTCAELAQHYGVAVLPARPQEPQDKAKVEAGVLFAERQILGALRHGQFLAFGDLCTAVQAQCAALNQRAFKKLPGNRRQAFLELERPALKPLPTAAFELGTWHDAKVWEDYHIQVANHFYSVPSQYIGRQVEVRLTGRSVEVFADGVRLAVHVRSEVPGKATTNEGHRPVGHNALLQRSADTYLRQGQLIGPHTLRYLEKTLAYFPHPEMSFRSCEGILRLKRQYGTERLEAACAKALEQDLSGFRVLDNILRHHREQQTPGAVPRLHHQNLRGADYYRQGADHAATTHAR